MSLRPALLVLALAGLSLHDAAAADGAPSAVPEGTPIERLEGPIDDEVAAWKAAKARFAERVREGEAEALAAVRREKARQEARLAAFYDPRIDALDEASVVQREAAIVRLETFLERYDDVARGSEVRLRLAELYYQDAEERWLSETAAYEEALAAADDDLEALEALDERGAPEIDLTRVRGLLQQIVDTNRDVPREDQYALLDVAYYMLAFTYEEPAAAGYDRTQARAIFNELVQARPESEYADAAHLLLGNYFFDENDFAGSIPEFEAVLAKGPDQKHASAAAYQLAWARYKLDQYDEAMARFVELLDASAEQEERTGRGSSYAADAITYLALSLSDQADQRDLLPLERADAYFAGLPEAKPYQWDVYRSLAKSLVDYGRKFDAIDVLRAMQDRPAWRQRPENPDLQYEIVGLLSRGYEADIVAAGEERLELTERYGEGSDWWVANRPNPDAQARARSYIESSLLDVAVELKVRAQEAGDPAQFSVAADKYAEYLERFPIADGYFQNQFQMADALFQAGRTPEAVDEYAALVRNRRYHDFGDFSLYRLFIATQKQMEERDGPVEEPPERPIARTYTTVGGGELQVAQLTPDQQAFLQAADTVLSHDFGPPVDGVDIGAVVDENRAKILYLPAQVLYFANDFEAARPRLQEIITDHPRTDEALYAANLLLNSYIVEKDNEQIRRWSREFAAMRLGASDALVEDKSRDFQDAYEKATYQLGTQAFESEDYDGAVTAFLDFAEEFPDSPNVADALLSAAFAYDRLGRAEDANTLYERFINEFPDHPEAKAFYFPIASNYEATFQFEKAIRYYEQLVERFPDYEDAPNALYMIGFLQEGLGRAEAAARTYERYAREFPDVPDREDVAFRAGAQYEQVSTDKALAFYRGYLREYGIQNPAHALEAQSRIASLYADKGRTRDADKALDEVVALFDRVVEAGADPGARGRDQAAAAAFRDLEAQFDAIVARELSGDEEKDAVLLTETIPAEVAALDAAINAYIDTYLSFEYTTAAMWLGGEARRDFAKLGFSLEPPRGLPQHLLDAYWELLEENFYPLFEQVEEQATNQLLAVTELAAKRKRHSVWVDKARESLNLLDGKAYPAVKEPIPGAVEAREPTRLVPIAPPAEEGSR